MLRSCALDFDGEWDQHLPLVKFYEINSYQSTIGMAPYEDLYGRRCVPPHYWEEASDKV